MKFHAVVMAAQRVGIVNELAVDAGVSHKCLIEMVGKKLIEHVLECLDASPDIGSISVVIDQTSVLDQVDGFQRLKASGKARAIEAKQDLFASFLAAAEDESRFPALVTTADNVLLTPEMVAHFCKEIIESGSDVAVALTPKQTLIAKYPDGQRRFHRFADGEYSNCNLYAVRNISVANTVTVFRTGGQFAKSIARVIKAFGLWNAIAYRFSLYSLDQGMERVSKRFNNKVVAIRMPFPEAPIDVDNMRSKKLATQILTDRLAGA
jgi:hypothetical protein